MAFSAVPGLLRAVVALAETTLPDCHVSLGRYVPDDIGTYVMVGLSDPDSSRPNAATSTQDWATVGPSPSREEDGELRVAVYDFNGDGDQDAAMSAVYEAAETLTAAMRASVSALSVGVSSVMWTSPPTNTTFDVEQDDSGAHALLMFDIGFRARL